MASLLPDTISGTTITLRRWAPAYTRDLTSMRDRSIEELRVWLPTTVIDLDNLARFFAKASERFDAGSEFIFAVFDASDELVGECSLTVSEVSNAEIGYWISSDRAGQGYATAAVEAITAAAFRDLPDV